MTNSGQARDDPAVSSNTCRVCMSALQSGLDAVLKGGGPFDTMSRRDGISPTNSPTVWDAM
jgi:hypothetical protein